MTKTNIHRGLILLALLALVVPLYAAPDRGVVDNPPGTSVALDTKITLAPGEAASLRGERTTFRLVEVLSDSRCPTDAECAFAGEAILSVEITVGMQTRAEEASSAKGPLQAGDYLVVFDDLAPQRSSKAAFDPDAYELTIHFEVPKR